VSVLEIPGKTGVDAGDFQQHHIAEFDLGSKRSLRSALAVLHVQLNVSFFDRVQRSSKGAIKGSIGNDFPHFQAPITLPKVPEQSRRNCDSTLLRNPRVYPVQNQSKKAPFNFC
jgi:hypothetical protein